MNDGWRTDAACSKTDPALFFPGGEGNGSTNDWDTPRAVCANCPVKGECLEFALTTNQLDGMWGGMSPEERGVVRRQRRTVAAAPPVTGRVCETYGCVNVSRVWSRWCSDGCAKVGQAEETRRARLAARPA